ncbi:BrnA antitoxin family protein [Shinella zoogloeoides]|uniref:BrnA antitoxin family protein n=1 Tax=Shinella zoogloeoides TaxID=352475 RepID=A0A6N8TC87_SHIZO|nr:BrnA antitoxin family protein [Shinella zoogloeoides]MXO00903.1 hypothetical protein [Shinella zoogloeoides]UEX80436.1 BrnA antitoxin family protein [Shinella zoogloeoides]
MLPTRYSSAKQITRQLDEAVVAKFHETGKSWQGRMNETLRKAASL